MRDALSLLDQALAFGGGSVKEQEVRDMLGSVSRDKVIRLLQAVLQRDAAQTLQVVAELAELSPDFENVLAELLSLLHHMSLAKTVPEALDEFVSARETLLKLSEEVSAEDLHLFYQIALIGRRDLSLSPDARNGFEMILLRMLAFRPAIADANRAVQSQQHSQSQPKTKDQAYASAQNSPQPVIAEPTMKPVASSSTIADIEHGSVQPSAQTTASATAKAAVASSNAASGDWRDIVNALGLGGLVKQLAINCTVKQRDGNNITLQIENGHSNLINPKAKQRLQQALGEYFNIDAQLEIKVVNNIESESPAQTTQRETKQRQQQAVQSINEDSFTQTLKENFNAEIVPGSIKPVS